MPIKCRWHKATRPGNASAGCSSVERNTCAPDFGQSDPVSLATFNLPKPPAIHRSSHHRLARNDLATRKSLLDSGRLDHTKQRGARVGTSLESALFTLPSGTGSHASRRPERGHIVPQT